MSLALLRIDDRLIHGQIVTTWVKEVNSNVIIIANDELSKNEFVKDVITMAAPPGIKTEVRGVEETAEIMKGTTYEKDRVMILTKNVEDVYKLYNCGLKLERINVGGMGAKSGTKVIYRNISVTDSQVELLQDLKNKGVEVEFKIVPNEKGMKL